MTEEKRKSSEMRREEIKEKRKKRKCGKKVRMKDRAPWRAEDEGESEWFSVQRSSELLKHSTVFFLNTIPPSLRPCSTVAVKLFSH